MTAQWVVVLRAGDRPDDTYVYGPLADKEIADRFADFLATEVDPARAYRIESPVPELLLFWNRQMKGEPTGATRPPEWPPHPGQVWQDRNGDRWICTAAPHRYLTCLTRQADDSAEEIWRLFGPLTFIQAIPTRDEEAPF